MSTLSTSIYGSQTNKGVGGLLSGLDTDDLVNQMTAATRNKINRQYQSKQKLLYKQEAYREISKKLLAFSDKYFSYSSGSKTNILSPKFFEANTIKSSSSYVNVTGNADEISNFQINSITSVAKASTYTTDSISSDSFSYDAIPSYMSSLAGDSMTIEFGGKKYDLKISKDFKYSEPQDENDYNSKWLQDIVDELNPQIESLKDENGHKLEYKVVDNQIKFTSETVTAKLVTASDDILKAFNIDKNDLSEDTLASSNGPIQQLNLIRTAEEVFLSSSITFEYNGVKKTIDLAKMSEGKDPEADPKIPFNYDTEGLADYLNTELEGVYGKDKVKVAVVEDALTFSVVNEESEDPDINLKSNVFSVSNISSDLSILTGIKSGDSNRLNMSKPIGDIFGKDTDYSVKINGKQIEGINSNMSINEIIKKINSDSDVNITYSTTTGKFVINSKETGAHTKINISGGLTSVLFGKEAEAIIEQNGADTEMDCTIDGQNMIITRSTANFSIDGINIELNKNAEKLTNVTFDVTNNSDEVVERVKQFINDYNEIITSIGSQTKEKPNRNYLPLTPEQMDEMEEKEIENWNKEAKKGVLFGDSKMNSIMNNFRLSMTGLTSVSSLTLASIGIAPASMDTSGKLVMDEKKFKEKLLENPDEIADLFTQSTTDENEKSGIGIEIQKIIRENIGAFGTSGILIEEAGLDGGLKSDQNNISLKMKEYDDKMKELKKDLEKERERYWNKFSALEQSLNSLNAQSSWLTDMMG